MAARRPAVSVVMTAFNRERYVAHAIESVLSQTFGDFELIIVDDCSTDATVDVARGYETDPRVRVIVNEKNLGDYPNRNHAASFATAEFLKYHDSDDLMYPHCLATMHASLAAEPRAAFALSGACSWSGGPSPMLLTARQCYEREFLGTGMFDRGPSNALFRTEAFRKAGGFSLAGAASDYVFWLRVCAHVNVLLVPADLHWYRRHPGQEISSEHAFRDYAAAHNVAWMMLNSPECPLTGEVLECAKANFVFTVARKIYWELFGGRPRQAWRIFRTAGFQRGDWIRFLRRRPPDPVAGTPVDSRGDPIVAQAQSIDAIARAT